MVSSVGFGYCLDRFDNWIIRTVILVVAFVGSLVTALATPKRSWLLYFSLSLLNFAGFGLLAANLRLGNLVPRYRASIIALISGAFDSSTITFLVFNELYKTGVSYKSIFLFYSSLISVFMVQTFFLTPKQTTPFALPENYKYGYKELPCFIETLYDELNCSENSKIKAKNYKSFENSEENPDNLTFEECIKEVYTWTAIIHVCVIMFVVTFFIGSFNSWIKTKVAIDQVDSFITVFGILQCLGVMFSPISGLLIDRLREKFSKKIGLRLGSFKSVTTLLFVSDGLVALMLILSLIPNSEIQYITLALQVICRAFIYSTSAAFANAVYPTSYFGVIYGITTAIGGVSLLLQYPVTLLLTRVLKNGFFVSNLFLLGLVILSSAHPIFLMILIHNRALKKVKEMKNYQTVDALEKRQQVPDNFATKNSNSGT